MSDWKHCVQQAVTQIDKSIRAEEDEALTLSALAEKLGYSEYYTSRKFRELSGMTLKEYIRGRKLALALRELRETEESILQIAVRYGFSTNEAFTRAFKEAYGVTPREYREKPVPAALRTVLNPMDCYLMGDEKMEQGGEVKTYFVRIPAHKFLHIRNYESIGYWDFWQKQSKIPGQDFDTISGLLHSIRGKLDNVGENGENTAGGQIMAWINEPSGRICSWGIPLAEAYGVRLPADYVGEIPRGLRLMDVLEGEYIVFEHGPFNFETESQIVEAKIEAAMKAFDYNASGYKLDFTPERVFYFYYDCERFFKYVRPVVKA